jgi:hypothetical protein
VYGYVPVPFNDTHPPPEEALKLGLEWSNDTVGVTCEGEVCIIKKDITLNTIVIRHE